jgi:DNA-binding transcriptional LysR family regulator
LQGALGTGAKHASGSYLKAMDLAIIENQSLVEVVVRIDPNRLIRLGELIKHGSFKKAADSLSLTQPALSQSIAQLEGEVGVRLIDRTPHGIVPTIFGEALLHHAKEIEWQLSEAAKRIGELAHGRHGMLSIGGTSGGPISILSLAICRLRETMSEMDVRVVEETWSSALLAQIDDRSLDVAICHEPDGLEMANKVALPIFRARRYLCVRAHHPEADKLTLSALTKYPFACPGGDKGISHGIKQIFKDLQMEFPTHQVIISNSLSAAKEVVLNSDAFAIFSDLSVLHERKVGTIKLTEIDEIVTPYWFYMVVREDYVGSNMLIEFISSLRSVCQDLGIPLHPDVDRIKSGRALRNSG